MSKTREYIRRFLVSWLVIFVTGFDNRVVRPVSRAALNKRKERKNTPVSVAESPMSSDGAVKRREEYLVQCEDTLINFDLCRPTGKDGLFFEEGFMRIGDRISPARENGWPDLDYWDPDKWPRTKTPAPAAAEFAPGKRVLFGDPMLSLPNPALLLRELAYHLQLFPILDVRVSDALLLIPGARVNKEVNILVARLFDVEYAGDMRGTFLFKAVFVRRRGPMSSKWRWHSAMPKFFTWTGRGPNAFPIELAKWLSGDAAELTRWHLLTAFGIESRRRCNGVGRITLVSRRHHKPRPPRTAVTVRKISNEDEIVAALRRNFPDAEVKKYILEDLPMKEQLRLIHGTDILIGMHGGALGFSMILPENAGMLELFPAHFLLPHYFHTFYPVVVNNGGHYRRWINLNPRREFLTEGARKPSSKGKGLKLIHRRDFTEVPSQTVVRKVKALQRRIHATADR